MVYGNMEGPTRSAVRFVGRPETVEALRRKLLALRAGTGGVSLVVGDTGVGKSTLVAELLAEIRELGVRLLVGRARALDEPPPFSLIQSALESARDDPLLRTDLDPPVGGGSMLIGFAPGFGEEVAPAPPGMEGRLLQVLGGVGPDGTSSPDQVLTGIAERFLEFTRHGPTVLVLEDLHRADKSSLTAIEFFANELKDRPLGILATSRPAASLSAPGRARLEAFESATHAEVILLPPMTRGETALYLRSNGSGRELSAEEVERRYSESGGNPFLLQAFEERPRTGPAPDAGSPTGPPRLDELGQRILDVAAVLGPEFPFDLLLRVSGEDEERLAEEVDRLVGRGLLLERSGEVLEFPEDRLRAEAYNALSERRRRFLHGRAGEALEAIGILGSTEIYALAHHFYMGRIGPKSVQYNTRAAEIAERAPAPDVAWEHFARALESQRGEIPGDPEKEAELVLQLARITEELGALNEAERLLRECLDREKEGPRLSPRRRATLEIFLARVLTDRGELPSAAELAQKVLATPGLADQLLIQIGAHHQLGQALYYEGKYPEAVAQHTEEIGLARQVGNPQVLARAQIWRVAALAMMGETLQAIAEAREVTKVRDGLGLVRESAQAHLFLGDILADARSPPEERKHAVEEYATAMRFAREAKDPRRVGWALYKTSELQRESGAPDQATESVRRACEIFGQMGDQVGLAVSLKVRAQLAMDGADYDSADTDLARARTLLEGLNHTLEELDVILRLAQLAAARGDLPRATDLIAELDRRNLLGLRPDLVTELDRVRESLAAPSPP
jgi:tetratricopeptide (TPR) repeat protein